MATIKVIKQLFSKTEAKAVAIFEREQARKNGRSFKKVEVVRAIELYISNEKMFSEIGKPWDEHFIVVIYYSKKENTVRNENISCKKVIPVVVERENVSVNLKSFTVIRYVSHIIKGEILMIVERYVVTDDRVKKNKLNQLYSSYSMAA